MAAGLALIVDDPRSRRADVARAVAEIGCKTEFADLHAADEVVDRIQPEVVIIAAPDSDAGIACLGRLRSAYAYARYLFIAADSSEDLAIRALHAGAHRYLKDPWTPQALQAAVNELLPADPDAGCVADSLVGGDRLVGRSAAIRELRAQLSRISPGDSNVLVTGETGTGKELVAELIHLNSRRAGKPLVCLNTAALPDTLLENELFGHERGAFTGATSSNEGKLSAADRGTAFLDEIGDVSLPMQAKLLRAIEGKPFYRLGGMRSMRVDVRIVAATNQDLERAVGEGRFRKDLYFRLNVVRVHLPPLRERREDIPLLVAHCLRVLNRALGRSVCTLAPSAMEILRAYHWPGNVRELRNVLEALLANLPPDTTGVVDVPPVVMRQLAFATEAPASERERLLRALADANWNKTKAASQLHWSRMTLYRKMQLHGVSPRK